MNNVEAAGLQDIENLTVTLQDINLRLRILEGAAGAAPGRWGSNWRAAFRRLRAEHPGIDAGWVGEENTGLYRETMRGANDVFRQFTRYRVFESTEDLVQAMVSGLNAEHGDRRSPFYQFGVKLSADILNGDLPVARVYRQARRWAAQRAHDVVRRAWKEFQAMGGEVQIDMPTDDEGNRHEMSTNRSVHAPAEEEAWIDLLETDSPTTRTIWSWIFATLDQQSRQADAAPTRLYLEGLRAGRRVTNRAIAKELGVSEQFVGQAIRRTQAELFESMPPRIRGLLDLEVEKAQLGYHGLRTARRRAEAGLRARLVRLAHARPELRPHLLPLLARA